MTGAKLMKLMIADIQLDVDNPRIKQFLEFYDKVSSEMIALALSDSSNGDASTTYRALKESIKASRGIIHPIVVNKDRFGKYTVIEGNTRLQVYREFAANEPDGPWNEIIALVYDNLDEVEKHKIRLQSHLVGPREWDPYSKAKYLWQLSEVDHLPMNSIISMCGGKKNDIQQYIDAYIYMERYYRPYTVSKGIDFDTKDFSKFIEYVKNSNIRRAVQRKRYSDGQFAIWVAEGNVDRALAVRLIPNVLKNEEATNAFEKKNLSEAEKILSASALGDADLSQYPYELLCKEAAKKLNELGIQELEYLAHKQSHAIKKGILNFLYSAIDMVVNDIVKREE